MPRACSVCIHKKAKEINEALISGVSFGKIAERFKLSKTTVTRHKNNCLAKAVKKIKDLEETELVKDREIIATGSAAWSKLEDMMEDLQELQRVAKEQRNVSGAVAAIREQSRIFELIAKMIQAAKEAEDPYEKKYKDLEAEVMLLYSTISSALVGHQEIREKLINAIDKTLKKEGKGENEDNQVQDV